ncbi:MAG: hypothetical protein QM492_05510 [Rhodobacterales bacterium]
MKIWGLIVKIAVWPGKKITAMLPDLGEEEKRLTNNVVNYVVWLALIGAVLGYYLAEKILPVAH